MGIILNMEEYAGRNEKQIIGERGQLQRVGVKGRQEYGWEMGLLFSKSFKMI